MMLSILSCNRKTSDQVVDKIIINDTLQFVSFSDEYDYPSAFFVTKAADTIQFLMDSAIQVSATMKVFSVLYSKDSVEEPGEGGFVEKFRIQRMRLLDKIPPFVKSSDHDKQMFFDLTGQWPVFCVLDEIEDFEMLAGIIEEDPAKKYILTPFQKTGSRWVKQKEIIYEAETIQFLDYFQHGENTNNLHYIYFSTIERQLGTANAGIATLTLCLYDFYDFMKVQCEGLEKMDNQISECNFDEDLGKIEDRGNYVALSFFKEKIDESTAVRTTDLDDPDFYEEKWLADNPNVKDFFTDNESSEGKIEWTYYPDPPVALDFTHQVIENDYWKVYSFFRNSVIAFDKMSSRYFVVYPEGCNHGCDKSVAFEGEDLLKISWEEFSGDHAVQLTISLETGAYSFSSPD